jgi:hypothetical protein
VPHHHHEKTKTDHHHHGSATHHHHEQHNEDKSLSHIFADAIHHPASDIVIHAGQSENVKKKTERVKILISRISQLILPELKPPDIPVHYRETYYSSDQDSFFLLRAPPVA